jgi:hypothetical protein
MARQRNIIPPVHLTTSLPQDLRARLDLHLWSKTEGRVPFGAYQRLLIALLTDYLNRVEQLPTETEELS